MVVFVIAYQELTAIIVRKLLRIGRQDKTHLNHQTLDLGMWLALLLPQRMTVPA